MDLLPGCDKYDLDATDRTIETTREVLNQTDAPAWVKQLNNEGDLVFVIVNRAFTENYGLTEEQALGKTDLEINIDKTLAQQYIDDDWKVLESGKPYDNTIRYIAPHGKTFIMRNIKYRITFPDGSLGVAGMVVEY
jgi:PAS domain-containing protein